MNANTTPGTGTKTLREWLAPYRVRVIATELGVDQTTVHRWIRGAAVPSGDKLQALAKYLGVDATSIVLETSIA